MSPTPTISALELLERASAFDGPMADLAQLYAKAGVRVFPCDPDTRRPLTPHAFKDRSSDSYALRAWWERWPTALIGLVPGDLDLFALDIDSAKAARNARDGGHLADALLVVETGGKSVPFAIDGHSVPPLHVYVPSNDTAPKIDGVVVRFENGYVIAPGSRRPNGCVWRVRKEGLGAWASTEQRRTTSDPGSTARDRERSQVEPPESGSRDIGLRAPDFDRVRRAVGAIPNLPETSRDTYVEMAHMIRSASGVEHEAEGLALFLEWAGKWEGGPVDTAEDERVFRTIDLKAVRTGWPQLHRLGAKHGYDNREDIGREARADFSADANTTLAVPPARRTLHDELVALRHELKAIPDALQRESVRDARLGQLVHSYHVPFGALRERLAAFDASHRLLSISALRGEEMLLALAKDPPRTLVPGYVFEEQLHVIFGAPGSFKTFIALDLALSVASGRLWLGRMPTRRAGVVFFAGEAAASLYARVAAWLAARGLSGDEITKLPFTMIGMVPTLGRGEDGLSDAIARVRAAEDTHGVKTGLVVLDNMTRIMAASGLSSTDPGEYGRVLSDIDLLSRLLGVATLAIAHAPVSNPMKPTGTYQTAANPDVLLRASRGDDSLTVTLSSTKSRSTRPMPPLVVRLREQDAHEFLLAWYGARGVPVPAALRGASDFGDSEVTSDHAFSSLVVDGGTPLTRVETDDLDRRVLDALHQRPNQSIRQLRQAVRGKGTGVDRAIDRLRTAGLVAEQAGPRGARLFRLTEAGVARQLNLEEVGVQT